MYKRNLFAALAAAAVAGADDGVVLRDWQAGGAGGSVAVGTGPGSTTVVFGAGGAVGGLHEVDDSTVAALGFWSAGAMEMPTGVLPRAIPAREAIRAAYDGSRLHVDLRADAASLASIRLVGADGRAVEPAWSGTLAVGTMRRTIDMDRHRGQVLYLLVEVGNHRRSFQVQDVSR